MTHVPASTSDQHSAPHAHTHAHAHDHHAPVVHQHAALPNWRVQWSLLSMGAGVRLLMACAAVVVLWLCVAWAVGSA